MNDLEQFARLALRYSRLVGEPVHHFSGVITFSQLNPLPEPLPDINIDEKKDSLLLHGHLNLFDISDAVVNGM